MRRHLLLWLPVLAGLALSFYLSAQPGMKVASPFPDYLAHGVEFLLLGLVVVRAFNGGMARRPTTRTLVWSVLFCLAWAVADEYHQSFVPGRDSSALDVVSDLVGSVAACGLFALLRPLAPSWA